ADLAGHQAYNFLLSGEVLQGTELAESFRYRFDLPAADSPGKTAGASADLAGHQAYNFLLSGEVLQGTELAESFRYRFDLPAADSPGKTAGAGTVLPLAFERHLAAGEYVLVLRVEDLP